MQKENKNVFGIYGMGTMGRNLLLNMADHGFAVAGFNRHDDKVALLMKESNGKDVHGFSDLKDFINSLKTPRAIMLLVTAGKAVDEVTAEILPLLNKGDIIIDGGNSHYTDTERRCKDLEEKGFRFIGMGVSGGEEGARKGPSMMPGGNEEAYKHLQPLFEAIAAKVNDEPCVTYFGPGAAGHFVKMVHNGIEYALMQLIAETYDLLKNGLHLDNNAIHEIFKQWNEGRLQSFLLEITTDIFAFKQNGDAGFLLDEIKDEAKAKGTGKWTSQIAMDLQVPIPTIDTAVAMRDLSKYKSLRKQIASMFDEASQIPITQNKNEYLVNLEKAFYFSMVITYSQGMHLLYKASHEFKYNIELDKVAKIWRGGCIIRSSFLENIYQAFQNNSDLEHILSDKAICEQIKNSLPGIRTIVSNAAINGIGIPAYASTLNYFDYLKSEKMPSNLIQAQRDYFGAHTYELIDKEGIFHTDWMDAAKKIISL
ncbi:MAG: NADP-dependent phosphogluconate dehydrogenase [Bacteroidia bacterium]